MKRPNIDGVYHRSDNLFFLCVTELHCGSKPLKNISVRHPVALAETHFTTMNTRKLWVIFRLNLTYTPHIHIHTDAHMKIVPYK